MITISSRPAKDADWSPGGSSIFFFSPRSCAQKKAIAGRLTNPTSGGNPSDGGGSPALQMRSPKMGLSYQVTPCFLWLLQHLHCSLHSSSGVSVSVDANKYFLPFG